MSILVDESTTFIIQGITGREAVTMAREVLDYGSKLLGGVTPGRKGRDVHGVPVEDTVRAFTERESRLFRNQAGGLAQPHQHPQPW